VNNLQNFGFLVPIAVIAIVCLVVFLITRAQLARRSASLRAVAERWQGRAFDGGLFDYSRAELQIGGTTARLQYTNLGKQTVTEITIHFPDPRLRMEIYPQTVVHQVRKFLGMQDIEVGVPAFDDRFIVQGNDPGLIREYLSRETQLGLQAVASFTFFFDLHLIIGGGTLRVTKRTDIVAEPDLRNFVHAFEGLFLALVAARSVGMEFLPSSAPPRISDTHCQVCGEGLHGTIVYCASCQTPHHLDCWQYIGSCSVYACGQKRYRPARK
jgi:hypothetical protein